MSYELTIELEGGKLEIEADNWKELEKMVEAINLERLEALLSQVEGSEGRWGTGTQGPSEVEARRRV